MIRVLRVMEYTYADTDSMISDMAGWKVQRTYRPNNRLLIKSTTVTPEFIEEETTPDA